MKLLISGYSANGRSSIMFCEADPQAGSFRRIWEGSLPSPSFLCKGPDKTVLGVCEKKETGEVFQLTPTADGYTISDRIKVKAGELCHISYANFYAFAAAYGTGNVLSVPVAKKGFSGKPLFFNSKEEFSRFHCVLPDLRNHFIYAVNIAEDRIYCFRFSQSQLLLNTVFPFLQLPPKEGPRQIVFSPSGAAYLITEYSNRLYALRQNPKTGELSVIDSVSSLTPESTSESFGAGVVESKSGIIYVSNRGANSISVFSLTKDQKLKKLQELSCNGSWPRHIALSEKENYLFSVNQRSDHITTFLIDGDGLLSYCPFSISFSEPSFIMEV